MKKDLKRWWEEALFVACVNGKKELKRWWEEAVRMRRRKEIVLSPENLADILIWTFPVLVEFAREPGDMQPRGNI